MTRTRPILFAISLACLSSCDPILAASSPPPDIISVGSPTVIPPSPDQLFWGGLIVGLTQIILQCVKRWLIPALPKASIPILSLLLGPAIDLILGYAGTGLHNPILSALLSGANVVLREIYDQVRKTTEPRSA